VIRALHIVFIFTLFQSLVCSKDPLPAVLERDTILSQEDSPHYINENFSISSGITLKIKSGAQLILSGNVSINNNGNLLVEGSSTDPVLFISDAPETRWRYISNQGTLIADYLLIRRAVRFVSSYGDTVIIRNCDVSDTYGGVGDDCIGVHYAKKLLILNTSLSGNPAAGKTDAIDLDGISGDTILGNIISGYSDDGIDIGTSSSNIVIFDNIIENCDMGISIGESSTALVAGNLVTHTNAGIQSHRGSVVYARQNTLYGNTYGIRAFHDDGESTSGGNIYVSNTIITNCSQGEVQEVDNSEVFFDYNLTDSVLLSGNGNITGSPDFIDAAKSNFYLSSRSDAIDAGNPDQDADGMDYLVDPDDRDPDGTRLDMGCYPYYQSSISLVEISPSNLSLEVDEEGQYSDWISILNHSASPYNLKGHYLSDRDDQPYKYKIEEDLYVPANDTLRLWMDNRDDLAHMQVPIKLSGSGEALLLSNPLGVRIEELVFPRVPVNYLYRKGESSDEWVYSTWPAGEAALSYDSLSNDPVYSMQGGATVFPLAVSLSSPDQVDSIFYSLDGRDPRLGTLVQTVLEIQEPMTLRSVVSRGNHVPGYIQAAAYFSSDSYSLPVVSLSTNEEHLFGATGIYTHYSNSGPNWERPASFSYYDKNLQFSAISGIRIQGGNSVFMPKKAFRLHFRGGYGSSRLESTPFEKGPSSYKNLVLRSGYDDDITSSTGTLLRDPFSTELWNNLGELATESDFGVLLLNNSYWGIYNIRESINEYFVEDHLGIKDFDMVRFLKEGPELKYGTLDEWNKMISYFNSSDFTRPEAYDEVSSFMDLNSLLNLLSLVHCSQYRSWTWGAFAIKPRGGRWRWTIWDTDRSYNIASWNGFTEYANTAEEKWPNFIPQKLIQNPQFRKELINRNCDLLNSVFVSENAIAVYDSLVTVLLPEIDAEFDRWNPGNRQKWDQNNESVRSFLRQRPAYVYEQMKTFFELEDTVKITLRIEGRGRVKLNSLVIDQESWEGIYMSGVPINLEAWPAEGGEFIEWRGISDLHRLEIDPGSAREIVAVFDTTSGKDDEPLVINEIMYNPANPEYTEWIELYNPNEHSVALGGFQLTDGAANNLFSFAENELIDPLGFLVVAGKSELFIYEHGSNIYLTGSFNNGESGFKLSNEGESVFLKNQEGELEDYVRYGVQAPWPEEANGKGPSLQLVSPALDNNDYASWYAGSGIRYTPGSLNGGNATEDEARVRESFIHVYPNPMGRVLFLDLEEEPGTEVEVKIYTLSGTLLDASTFHPRGAWETFTWEHGIINPGAYILKVAVLGGENEVVNSQLLIFSGKD
jgi:CotH kinase protein/Lamin Tail Domain/Right handed beta helix region